MNHKKEFARLLTEADVPEFRSIYLILMSAEQNAGETEGVKYDPPEYWRVAYDSIAFTSDFEASRNIMVWFEMRGYKW